MMIQSVNMKNWTRFIGYQAHTIAQPRREVSCGKQTRKVQRSSHIVKPEHRNDTVDFVAINTHFFTLMVLLARVQLHVELKSRSEWL